MNDNTTPNDGELDDSSLEQAAGGLSYWKPIPGLPLPFPMPEPEPFPGPMPEPTPGPVLPPKF